MLHRLLLPLIAVLLLTSNALASSASKEAGLARSFPAPPIRARAGVVMDANTGAILAQVNAHLHLPMASTTKVMTALLAIEMGKLTDRIAVPKAAFNFESDATVMGVHPGQIVTLKDLLYGLLLPSGADAANTIAIHYGGSESHFVALMNHRAATLGMHDTHFMNAHGLTAAGHYTSAYDLANLGRYASFVPDLMKVASTHSYTWNGHVLTNLNHPLFWYPGVDGIKPGYTDDAGICQLLDARRNDRHVIVSLLNTPDLVLDARNFLNFGLHDYTWVQSGLTYDGPGLVQSGVDAHGTFQYFPSTGHYLRGRLLAGFTARGGAATLGFPRTEPLTRGNTQVQYFQNGALSLDLHTSTVTRLQLGLTPLPLKTVTPTVTPSPTATRPPAEATVVVARTGTPAPTVKPTSRPRPTTTPLPKPIATATPGLTSFRPASFFGSFIHAHPTLLGVPVGAVWHASGYSVQLFAYGALVYNNKTHVVAPLPLGDRFLNAKRYLPDHAGNTYPANFAGSWVLKAIGWLPSVK
jgi:D-alanyl-D-alanine carboxypeptidase